MRIPIIATATQLSSYGLQGGLSVPDLEDMIAEAVGERRDFNACYTKPEDIAPVESALRCGLSRPMKKADRVLVDELTLFLVEDMPCCREDSLFFYVGGFFAGAPRKWAVGYRYRQDVDWWLVMMATKYLEPFFLGLPITVLLHTTELNHWNNASHFFAEFIWTYIVQSKAGTATPRPAQAVYPFFQRMLKTEQLAPTFEALKNVNFYQVVDTNGKQLRSTAEYQDAFSVAINTSWAAWSEVEKILTVHYPAFFQSGGATHASEVWENFKRDKRSVLLLARSVQVNEDKPDEPPMILGFLAGGIHPTSENPHIMAVCVLPDERRRGIGRALVRRFFAHTAYNEVCCQLHIKPGSEPYEQAAFLTSLNGILKKMFGSFWTFEMVNPFLK